MITCVVFTAALTDSPSGEKSYSVVSVPAVWKSAILIQASKLAPFRPATSVSSWGFEGARDIQAPDGALVLVESDSGEPLVYIAREKDR